MDCTFFDTAESYGTAASPHDNEELPGECSQAFPGQGRHCYQIRNLVREPGRSRHARRHYGFPSGNHTPLCRGVPAEAADRPYRLVLPAPSGPGSGAGDCGIRDGRTDKGRQNPALGHFRTRRCCRMVPIHRSPPVSDSKYRGCYVIICKKGFNEGWLRELGII